MPPSSSVLSPPPPSFFFFNDTATTEIYTLSLHDALPISCRPRAGSPRPRRVARPPGARGPRRPRAARRRRTCARERAPGSTRRPASPDSRERSEEHTSELQSPCNLVCRLLLEKKKKKITN